MSTWLLYLIVNGQCSPRVKIWAIWSSRLPKTVTGNLGNNKFHVNVHANMLVEYSTISFKTFYLQGMSNKQIDDLINVLLEIEADYYWSHKKIIVCLNLPKKDIGKGIRYEREINTLMPTWLLYQIVNGQCSPRVKICAIWSTRLPKTVTAILANNKFHVNIHANMLVESFHNKLKTFYLQWLSNKQIDDVIDVLLEIEVDYYWSHKNIIVSLNVPTKDIGRDIRYEREINTLMPTWLLYQIVNGQCSPRVKI